MGLDGKASRGLQAKPTYGDRIIGLFADPVRALAEATKRSLDLLELVSIVGGETGDAGPLGLECARVLTIAAVRCEASALMNKGSCSIEQVLSLLQKKFAKFFDLIGTQVLHRAPALMVRSRSPIGKLSPVLILAP